MAKQSENLTMGRGELYFAKFTPGTFNLNGYRFLGNCPSFKLTRVENKQDHYSSTGGFKLKDASFNMENSFTGVVQTDDFSVDNLALWGGASAVTKLTNASATGSTSNFSAVEPGYSYQLGMTTLNPTGDRKVSNVVVTDDAATPNTFQATTDYVLDADNGMIEVVTGGSITSGTNLIVTYDTAATTRNMIMPGETTIEGALKFISKNPTGPQRNLYVPRISVTASGDLNLIADQGFLTMDLALETLILNGMPPYYMEDTATAG